MDLKKYNVTVCRFYPQQGLDSGEQFILPVDSPDEEHAISAAMSNAVAFTTKLRAKLPQAELLPIAFTCVAVAERD